MEGGSEKPPLDENNEIELPVEQTKSEQAGDEEEQKLNK